MKQTNIRLLLFLAGFLISMALGQPTVSSILWGFAASYVFEGMFNQLIK